MSDSGKFALYAAGLAAVALAMSRSLGVAAGGQLTMAQVRDLVKRAKARHGFPEVPEVMARAVVEIESARKPFALRPEPQIPDFSAGLMQTLISTAADLWNKGWRAYPRPEFGANVATYDLTDGRRVTESPAAILLRPEVSVYYGMAYLQWLTSHPWYNGTEQWQVRAYNGGPGGPTRSVTLPYWDKYRKAKERVLAFDSGNSTGV